MSILAKKLKYPEHVGNTPLKDYLMLCRISYLGLNYAPRGEQQNSEARKSTFQCLRQSGKKNPNKNTTHLQKHHLPVNFLPETPHCDSNRGIQSSELTSSRREKMHVLNTF